MIRSALAAIVVVTLALPAAAQQSGSAWRSGFNQGITQYLTGEWDSSTGGALSIACLPDGRASISAQIKGETPPANSTLRLTTSSRTASREWRFTTDAKGDVILPAGNANFGALWASLRGHDIVTIRYPDGRFSVQSLDGASKTLPAAPCR